MPMSLRLARVPVFWIWARVDIWLLVQAENKSVASSETGSFPGDDLEVRVTSTSWMFDKSDICMRYRQMAKTVTSKVVM